MSLHDTAPSRVLSRALEQHLQVARQLLETVSSSFAEASERLRQTRDRRGRIFVCGNGGSAADAQHFAAELISDRMAGVALTVDSSALTALGNDRGWERVFAIQLAAQGRPGDVLVAISTSGQSANVVQACRQAQRMDIPVIALTGNRPSELSRLASVVLAVPSGQTQVIQEMHILLLHSLWASLREPNGS